jgi:hypothetical protein
MTLEETRLHSQRRERIARTKWWLRRLPRRTNIHRYPVLKWFARTARARSYLWCFRVKTVVPAIYAGCILSLLPLYGVQLMLAFILALVLRANLPILFGLQFITNPLTAIPIYFASFQIGRICLHLIGIHTPQLNRQEAAALFSGWTSGDWHSNLTYLFTVIGVTSLGSLILGIFCGTVGSLIYRAMAREVQISYLRLKELQARRHAASAAPAEQLQAGPSAKPGTGHG